MGDAPQPPHDDVNAEGHAKGNVYQFSGALTTPAPASQDVAGAPIAIAATTSQARSDRRQAAAERRRLAYQLRLSGCSYRDVSRTLGISLRQAFADCKRELRDLNQQCGEDVATRRAYMLAQIENAKRGLAPAIHRGDARAVLALEKLLARESALVGADQQVSRHQIAARVESWDRYSRSEEHDPTVLDGLNDAERARYRQLAKIPLLEGNEAEQLAAAASAEDLRLLYHVKRAQFMPAEPRFNSLREFDGALAVAATDSDRRNLMRERAALARQPQAADAAVVEVIDDDE